MKTFTVTIHFAGVSYNMFQFNNLEHTYDFIKAIPKLRGYIGFSCESEENGVIEKDLFKIKLK